MAAEVGLPIAEAAAYGRLRRLLTGPPLSNDQEISERLTNPVALAILSSDALSSVAYATEEMLKVLVPVAGLPAYRVSLPLAAAIVSLLLLLVLSYRQTIKAYPNAGGAYVVTRDNFGLIPAQAAGVALLIDYTMTVAVSTSAAVAALYSYFPALFSLRVLIGVFFVWLIAWGNLRGIRAAGRLFAAPTYFFLAAVAMLLAAGLRAAVTGHLHPLPPPPGLPSAGAALPALLVVRAYASGITAVAGVEAISNGVSVFRPVEWRNARRVLTWMGAILAVSFSGITLLAWRLQPVPSERRTLVSQLGAALFGETGSGRAALLVLQVATTAILVLAANTSFADFPRLASFHARDSFLPRSFMRRGPRLEFTVGIVTLAVMATTVMIVLGADVHRMIPLYAVGVFASFTFSQAGMTRRHLRVRQDGWRTGLLINTVGALGSGSALLAVLVTKFAHGAWVVVVLIPAGVGLTLAVRRHYQRVDGWLAKPSTGCACWRRLRVVIGLTRPDAAMAAAARNYAAGLEPEEGVDVTTIANRRRARAALGDIRRRQILGSLTLLVVPLRLGEGLPPPWAPARLFLRGVRQLSDAAAGTLVVDQDRATTRGAHACVVAVGAADGLARRSLALARRLRPDELHAVHVELDPEEAKRVADQWRKTDFGIELETVPAPYRERGGPLLAEVRRLRQAGAAVVTVVIGRLSVRWWQRPLHCDDTAAVRAALRGEPGTAVTEHLLRRTDVASD